jgi:hypothetical protein
MSCLHNEALLETLFEEVLAEYPQFDEEQCESIDNANNGNEILAVLDDIVEVQTAL